MLLCESTPDCNSITVREKICMPDIELLSIDLRPLPCEFPQLFLTLVYIHPRSNTTAATQAIVDTVCHTDWSLFVAMLPNFIWGN